MWRYFIKQNDNEVPLALFRLSIDNQKQEIRDEFWNPKLKDWQKGSFGMYQISVGDVNVIEVNEQQAKKVFPKAPWMEK